MHVPAKPILMSKDDLKREAGIGSTLAQDLMNQGAFEIVKIGRLTRITRGSFDAWLANLPRQNAA